MPSYKILDKNGATVHRGLTMEAASSIVEVLMRANPTLGAVRIVSDGPVPEIQQEQPAARHVPPVVSHLRSRHAATVAEAAQAVEPGQERENLQARIGHRDGMREVVAAAQEAAAKAAERVRICGAELERLRGIDQAEIDAAATALAAHFKAGGEPEPAQPNLGAQRAALLDAETQHAAAEIAQRKLDAELQAARRALATAESDVETAAAIVIKQHLAEVAQELATLWTRANELRAFLGSAEHVGFPLSLQQLELVRGPGDVLLRQGPQIANWKARLTQDADAQFDNQPSKVAA